MTRSIEESQRCTIALLRDLAELATDMLGEGEPSSVERRREVLTSALGLIDRLSELGGGAIGLARLEDLRDSLAEDPSLVKRTPLVMPQTASRPAALVQGPLARHRRDSTW